MERYEALIAKKNTVDESRYNGIYERWVNLVLTRGHVPPFWMFDPNPETNPHSKNRNTLHNCCLHNRRRPDEEYARSGSSLCNGRHSISGRAGSRRCRHCHRNECDCRSGCRLRSLYRDSQGSSSRLRILLICRLGKQIRSIRRVQIRVRQSWFEHFSFRSLLLPPCGFLCSGVRRPVLHGDNIQL